MFRNFKHMFVVGAVSLSAMSPALSQMSEDGPVVPINSFVPVVNPTNECLLEQLRVPENMRDYSYLSNKDCKAYFVKPAAFNFQTFFARAHPNLVQCEYLDAARDNIHSIDFQISHKNQLIKKLILEIGEMTEQGIDDPQKEARLNAKIEKIGSEKKDLVGERELARASLADFGDIIGAEYRVVLDSRVLEKDLRTLSIENERIVKEIDANGVVRKYLERPLFQKAKIVNSLFSFIYHSPSDESSSGSTMESNIPGLEVLQQEGGVKATAHVSIKGNEQISGYVSLKLNSVCGYEEEMVDGTYTIKETGDPLFVVNQYYEVQQQFSYGYVASLKTDQVVTQIVDEVISNTRDGFRKDQIFNNKVVAKLDTFLKFEWSNEFSTNAHELTGEMIQEIKTGIFAKFVDNYFDQLVQAGQIEIVTATDVTAANGGEVDVDQVGTRCWIERKWWGRRRKKCTNFTYKVKKWVDGLTKKDLTTRLTINGSYGENVKVNEMVPFYYTTTFATKKAIEEMQKAQRGEQ